MPTSRHQRTPSKTTAALRFLVAAAFATSLLSACTSTVPVATTAPSQPKGTPSAAATKMSDTERDALALLVLGPKPNEVKQCVVSSLELNTALVGFKRGKMPVDEVGRSLIGNNQGSVLTLREQQFAAWKKGAIPSDLADMQFTYCKAQSQFNMSADPVIKTCFNVAVLPASAEIEKAIGRSVEQAVTTLQKGFEGQIQPDYVRKVTEDVFKNDSTKDDYAAHRRVFIQCVFQNR